VDTIRATTFGAKYDVSPLTIAGGMNFHKDKEALYAGLMYKLMEETLTLSLEGHATAMGAFDTAGAFDLGEKAVFKDAATDGRFEAGLTLKQTGLAGQDGKKLTLEFNPYAQYDFIEKVARVRLGIDFSTGVGDSVKDNSNWLLTLGFGWSLNGKPNVDPDDIGTGFILGYKYGVKVAPPAADVTTNQLYFGFKASF
jgi:hypothetical protein